jgi:hypothetical protein
LHSTAKRAHTLQKATTNLILVWLWQNSQLENDDDEDNDERV